MSRDAEEIAKNVRQHWWSDGEQNVISGIVDELEIFKDNVSFESESEEETFDFILDQFKHFADIHGEELEEVVTETIENYEYDNDVDIYVHHKNKIASIVRESWWDSWASSSITGETEELKYFKENFDFDSEENKEHLENIIDSLGHYPSSYGESLEENIIDIFEKHFSETNYFN